MPSIHESDILPTLSVASLLTPARVPCAEAHFNPWLTGTKGAPITTVGTPASVAAGVGLTMTSPRQVVQTNAPAELILGDSSGAWVINLTEIAAISTSVTNFNTVYMP